MAQELRGEIHETGCLGPRAVPNPSRDIDLRYKEGLSFPPEH